MRSSEERQIGRVVRRFTFFPIRRRHDLGNLSRLIRNDSWAEGLIVEFRHGPLEGVVP